MSAVALAGQTHALLVQLAEISDRLGLKPVAVNLTASTYGSRRIAVQFGTDDQASVDALADEIGVAADDGRSPTLYDRKGPVDGVEWGVYCGITAEDGEVSR